MTARREPITGAVHDARPHDSAHLHVTGAARYTDDLPKPQGTLAAAVGLSARAHARIRRLDLGAVVASPGVVAVITARDIPGPNDIGAVAPGDPVLAENVVHYAGQVIFAVAAESTRAARRAVRLAVVEYEDLEPLVTIDDALAGESFVLPSHTIRRGDAPAALAAARHRLAGRLSVGGQDHLYLEGQVSLVLPLEDGDMHVYCSTQHPTEVQRAVGKILQRPANAITVEVRRLGGGFGGKETQAAQFAVIAALLARATGRPVKLRLDRADDMAATGKRHDFAIQYDVGFDDDGRICGLDLALAARAGMSADLSGPVSDRAMLHVDNAYYLEHVTIISHRCRTNTVSNTAFRGFGAPQSMMGIEQVLDEIARFLGRDPLDVRAANLYGHGERATTPYGMTVEPNVLPDLVTTLARTADYHGRRTQIADFNASSRVLKRGLALTPVKFGIAFTATHVNQAGALVHVYGDGSVHLNHGGTEMGQGLYVKVAQIVAHELQIDVDRIKVSAANTAKVPNTSPTAASSSTDLNGAASRAAARTIKERLTAFASEHFAVPADGVRFDANHVQVGERSLPFAELAALAHQHRVPLSATGFFRTPRIGWDRDAGHGRPFLYFACGAAVSEVVVDTLTGEMRVARVDVLHDCGRSINPAIDRGQIEGGFVQGMGWLTSEELWWDDVGRLATRGPSTYKIPVMRDVPDEFSVELFTSTGAPSEEEVVHRSKAVGEPPLMLAISVFQAIKDAVASTGGPGARPRLHAPATPERILLAIDDLRRRSRTSA